MINGFTGLDITKLDVLSNLDEINVCVSYQYNDKNSIRFPSVVQTLEKVKPEYRTFPGWKSDVTGVTSIDALPQEARAYIQFIEKILGVPAIIVSTGPKRSQTIERFEHAVV